MLILVLLMSTFSYDVSLPHLEKFMVSLQFQIYLCLFYPSLYLRNVFTTHQIHQRNFPHEGWTDITLNLIHEYWYRVHWKMQGKSDCVFEVSLEDKHSPIVLKDKSFWDDKEILYLDIDQGKEMCGVLQYWINLIQYWYEMLCHMI